MPTGYTAGILDGTIETFEEFAKLCTRAFGATIHMKDDSFDTEYREAIVDKERYLKQIKETEERIKSWKTISNDEIIKQEKESYIKAINGYKDTINERIELKKKLGVILEQAKQWTPPSKDHENYKTFMIQQLEDTIENDCDISSYIKWKEELETVLENIDADVIRKECLNNLKRNITMTKDEMEKAIKGANSRNQWVKDVFESLNK